MKDYECSELYETMNPGTVGKKIGELEDRLLGLIEDQDRQINDLKIILRETLTALELEGALPSSWDNRLTTHYTNNVRLFCNQD